MNIILCQLKFVKNVYKMDLKSEHGNVLRKKRGFSSIVSFPNGKVGGKW